jgi:hypothetical protein
MSLRAGTLSAVIAARLLAACGDDGGGDPPVFPADYAATYQQVRNCRLSIEHDLVRIRVLASPDALQPYTTHTAPFPTGAIVLKEEYGTNDTACAGPIINYTVMQKLDAGTSPETIGWTWQDVDASFRVKRDSENIARCIGCHTDCGKPPDGYDGTCTLP